MNPIPNPFPPLNEAQINTVRVLGKTLSKTSEELGLYAEHPQLRFWLNNPLRAHIIVEAMNWADPSIPDPDLAQTTNLFRSEFTPTDEDFEHAKDFFRSLQKSKNVPESLFESRFEFSKVLMCSTLQELLPNPGSKKSKEILKAMWSSLELYRWTAWSDIDVDHRFKGVDWTKEERDVLLSSAFIGNNIAAFRTWCDAFEVSPDQWLTQTIEGRFTLNSAVEMHACISLDWVKKTHPKAWQKWQKSPDAINWLDTISNVSQYGRLQTIDPKGIELGMRDPGAIIGCLDRMNQFCIKNGFQGFFPLHIDLANALAQHPDATPDQKEEADKIRLHGIMHWFHGAPKYQPSEGNKEGCVAWDPGMGDASGSWSASLKFVPQFAPVPLMEQKKDGFALSEKFIQQQDALVKEALALIDDRGPDWFAKHMMPYLTGVTNHRPVVSSSPRSGNYKNHDLNISGVEWDVLNSKSAYAKRRINGSERHSGSDIFSNEAILQNASSMAKIASHLRKAWGHKITDEQSDCLHWFWNSALPAPSLASLNLDYYEGSLSAPDETLTPNLRDRKRRLSPLIAAWKDWQEEVKTMPIHKMKHRIETMVQVVKDSANPMYHPKTLRENGDRSHSGVGFMPWFRWKTLPVLDALMEGVRLGLNAATMTSDEVKQAHQRMRGAMARWACIEAIESDKEVGLHWANMRFPAPVDFKSDVIKPGYFANSATVEDANFTANGWNMNFIGDLAQYEGAWALSAMVICEIGDYQSNTSGWARTFSSPLFFGSASRDWIDGIKPVSPDEARGYIRLIEKSRHNDSSTNSDEVNKKYRQYLETLTLIEHALNARQEAGLDAPSKIKSPSQKRMV